MYKNNSGLIAKTKVINIIMVSV